jgi:hypothetical protein
MREVYPNDPFLFLGSYRLERSINPFSFVQSPDYKGNRIKREVYLSNLQVLSKLGTGGFAEGSVVRLRDVNDTYFGGDNA